MLARLTTGGWNTTLIFGSNSNLTFFCLSTVQRDALLLLEHSPPLLHQFDLPPEINEILSGAGPLLRADHQEVWLGASTGSSGANLRAASGLVGLGEK